MVFQTVPETVEVAVLFTCNSVPMQNTFHARKTGGYSLADIESLADAVDDAVGAGLLQHWSNNVTYDGVEIRGLESLTDLAAGNGDNAGAGQVSSVPMPNNCAFAVKKLSGFTGRSARGRVFIAGIPQADKDTNENYLTSAAAAAFTSDVDDIRDAIDTEGWVPVIVSRYSEGQLRELNGTPTAVTFEWTSTAVDDNRIDSRRDRMPTGG